MKIKKHIAKLLLPIFFDNENTGIKKRLKITFFKYNFVLKRLVFLISLIIVKNNLLV